MILVVLLGALALANADSYSPPIPAPAAASSYSPPAPPPAPVYAPPPPPPAYGPPAPAYAPPAPAYAPPPPAPAPVYAAPAPTYAAPAPTYAAPAPTYAAPAPTYAAPAPEYAAPAPASAPAPAFTTPNKEGGELLSEEVAIPPNTRVELRDDRGQYSHGFSDDKGTQVSEQGSLITTNGGWEYVIGKRGSYSYISPEGIPISVEYVADENGFRPVGAHIP